MRLGLASIYSFRPHVEQLYYLALLLKEAGHELFFLTCDGVLSNCYPRALKRTSKYTECLKCMAGSIRSYPVSNIQTLKKRNRDLLSRVERDMLSSSSACTLLRTEAIEDTCQPEYIGLRESFHESVEISYSSTLEWIDKNALDGIICFNGRMEVTRAITYACEKRGLPFLTQERPWFSNGLQLIPQGDCLSLKENHRFNRAYQDKCLSKLQAHRSAKVIASRFLRTNLTEWRAYNLNPEQAKWPKTTGSGLKALILPSSLNEFYGHPEWENSWKSSGHAFEWVLDELDIDNKNVLLRCHPNWNEKIGHVNGFRSENYYTTWAKQRDIHCIASFETANTFDLIKECDILLVNSSSAAFEAGACGKRIICIGPSTYEGSGIALHIHSEQDRDRLNLLSQHDPLCVMRKTLRYGYTMTRRFPQYVDYVRALSPTRYAYFEGANPDRIIRMMQTGLIEADDPETTEEDRDESTVVSMLEACKWDLLADFKEPIVERPSLRVTRRFALRWLDSVREKFPRGDR